MENSSTGNCFDRSRSKSERRGRSRIIPPVICISSSATNGNAHGGGCSCARTSQYLTNFVAQDGEERGEASKVFT